jgi:hypothetical protein
VGGWRCTCGLRYRNRREVLRQRLCTELYIVLRVTKTSDCEIVMHVAVLLLLGRYTEFVVYVLVQDSPLCLSVF